MKAKLNKFGNLEIERSGDFLIMDCIYNNTNCCGHWCPKFREPFEDSGSIKLRICNSEILSFDEDEFEDERS